MERNAGIAGPIPELRTITQSAEQIGVHQMKSLLIGEHAQPANLDTSLMIGEEVVFLHFP